MTLMTSISIGARFDAYEHAGIKLIALALVLVDGSQLAKFGDESIATQINKESAIQPGEMDRSARDVLRGSDAAIKSRGC